MRADLDENLKEHRQKIDVFHFSTKWVIKKKFNENLMWKIKKKNLKK